MIYQRILYLKKKSLNLNQNLNQDLKFRFQFKTNEIKIYRLKVSIF